MGRVGPFTGLLRERKLFVLYIVLLLMLHVVLSELLLHTREIDIPRAQVVRIIYNKAFRINAPFCAR